MDKIFLIQNNNYLVSHDEFNKTIGNTVVSILKKRHTLQTGGVYHIPANGKVFIIGDLHEQVDILLDIFTHIQSSPETNLDTNPENKIILMGDIISPTKSILTQNSPLGLDQASASTLRGDPIIRATSWLIANYPHQVFIINGNHEIGFLLGAHLLKNPYLQYAPALFQEMISSHHFGSASTINYQHLVDRIELSPMLIQLNFPNSHNKYIIMHSPGSSLMPSLHDIYNKKNWQDWISPKSNNLLFNIFAGHGDISEQAMFKLLKSLNAEKVFFGHAAPEGLVIAMANNRLVKIDTSLGVTGFNAGCSCYVDSQTRTMHSGYIILDFNNNEEITVPMTQVTSKHPCSQLAIKAAQIQAGKNWRKQWTDTLKIIC